MDLFQGGKGQYRIFVVKCYVRSDWAKNPVLKILQRSLFSSNTGRVCEGGKEIHVA